MKDFKWTVRVYHEDTDGGGIVYYANYLKFMERARTEYLRSLGFEQDSLLQTDKCLFVVTHVSIDYVQPAVFNDQLTVTCEPESIGKARFKLRQVVVREVPGGATDQELTRADVTLACLDSDSLTVRRIPPAVKIALDASLLTD